MPVSISTSAKIDPKESLSSAAQQLLIVRDARVAKASPAKHGMVKVAVQLTNQNADSGQTEVGGTGRTKDIVTVVIDPDRPSKHRRILKEAVDALEKR